MRSLTIGCLALSLAAAPCLAAEEPAKPVILPVLPVVNGQDYGVTTLYLNAAGDVIGYVAGPGSSVLFIVKPGTQTLTLTPATKSGRIRYLGSVTSLPFLLGGDGVTDTVQVQYGIVRDTSMIDLGNLEVSRNGVVAGAIAPGNLVYVVRSSDGHLLRADLMKKTVADLGATADSLPFQPDKRRLPKAIAVMPDGTVYTSGKGGTLIKVASNSDKIELTGVSLPCVPGREAWANADALVAAPDGTLYGGTGDGYIFHYDPKTNKLRNLGKPLRQSGIPVLLWGPDGNLHGVGGEAEGMPHLFRYSPATGEFALGGIPGLTSRSPGAPISCGVFDKDGRLILGQAGRLASVIIYPPGGDK